MPQFIKVVVIRDSVEVPTLLNLDRVESFQVDEEGLQILYIDKDKNGSNWRDFLKGSAKDIVESLEKAKVYTK